MDNYDNSGMNKADYVMGRLFVDDTKKYLKPETPIFIDDTKNYVDFVNDFVDFSKNAKKNSVRSDDNHFEEKKYSASKHSTDNKKAAKIALGSLLAITVAAGITYGSVRLIDEISIYRSLEPYRSIVTENTYRTEDNQGYWYDTSRIAEGILNQEDVTLAVYGVYNKIGYNQGNKLLQMDDVISDMRRLVNGNPDIYKDIKTYDSFDDYLISCGFVDSSGKASVKQYEKAMDQYALAAKGKGDMPFEKDVYFRNAEVSKGAK